MVDEQQRLHAIVHGRVQGVNFRYYTRHTARELGVRGWVRNLPDETVEVTAEGTRTQLENLLRFLYEGPPHARVNSVETEWLPPTGEFAEFAVHYS